MRARSPQRQPFARGSRRPACTVALASKLGDVRYVYTWDEERVFKIVSFFLAHARRGRIGALPPGMEIEVAEARWLPLAEGPSFSRTEASEKMVAKAVEMLANDPL